MRTLFVTTARDKSAAAVAAATRAADPLTVSPGGGVYALRVDVPGIPNTVFDPQV